MDVTHAIAEILSEEGVKYLFGFPSNPLLDTGAAKDAGIRPIVTRQERTAAHMADAIGRVTSGDQIAAFCCQHGPGTENSFGGIAQAFGESAPLVAIPAGYDRSNSDTDPKFNSRLNYHQISKQCEQLTDPSAVGETMRRAFSAVRNGRPRPAVIEVPLDVFPAEVSDVSYSPAESGRTAPNPTAIDEVADALLNADLPVIFAGQGVHYARGWEPLKELAEILEAPVGTSLNGKSAFPETHPLSLGAGSLSEPAPLSHFLDKADFLFGIGCSFTSTAYGITVPSGKTIVHSTLDPTDINKDVAADYALIGDARLTLEALVDSIERKRDGDSPGRQEPLSEEIASIRSEWLEKWRPKLTSDEVPINPYRVIHDLINVVDPADAIITHDAGNPRDFLAPFWKCTEPLSYIGWGKTTQLGYGLGLAMGAKLARPEKLCINVWGDGAIGMTGLDFQTAVREDIPILSILLNNYEMAGYDTPFGGDFAEIAEALGGYGERVKQPDDIVPALERGIDYTGEGVPVLLEFITSDETELSRPDLEK